MNGNNPDELSDFKREKYVDGECPICGEECCEEVNSWCLNHGWYCDPPDEEKCYMESLKETLFECAGCGLFFNEKGMFKTLCFEPPIASLDFGIEEEINQLVKILEIKPDSYEALIVHALESHCFIEAISLIHNVIEAYLKMLINNFFSDDVERNQILKEKMKPQYMIDYSGICYVTKLIDKKLFKEIKFFNKERNKVIHELMQNPAKIEHVKEVARRGRKIQFKLSPLNHSEEEIAAMMKIFDEQTKGPIIAAL